MVSSKATTVTAYLKELPAERRAVVSAVRTLVKKSLPKGFEESCLRFRSVDDLATDVLGEALGKVGVDELIDQYEAARKKAAKRR